MGMERKFVADVMTVDVAVVAVDASLEEADVVLRSTVVTGIPVVDGSGVLVGVLSHADLAAYRFADPRASGDTTPSDPEPAKG
jgi:CBS domain-containing protein